MTLAAELLPHLSLSFFLSLFFSFSLQKNGLFFIKLNNHISGTIHNCDHNVTAFIRAVFSVFLTYEHRHTEHVLFYVSVILKTSSSIVK